MKTIYFSVLLHCLGIRAIYYNIMCLVFKNQHANSGKSKLKCTCPKTLAGASGLVLMSLPELQ